MYKEIDCFLGRSIFPKLKKKKCITALFPGNISNEKLSVLCMSSNSNPPRMVKKR